MASSIPGFRPLPASKYDLDTYWGRVKHCAELSDPRYVSLDFFIELIFN